MPALLLTDADWHIYTSVNQAAIGLDNGLAPLQCQAIIWTNVALLWIGPLGNVGENVMKIQWFPFKEINLEMSLAKRLLLCVKLNA